MTASAILAAACLAALQVGVSAQLTVDVLYQYWDVAPGAACRGELAITNSASDPIACRVFATDYCFFADGTSIQSGQGGIPRSNAAWIWIERAEELVVPGGSELVVPYEIRVPLDVEPVGTYWSLLHIEPAVSSGAETGSVAIRFTYGIQIITNFGDTGLRQIEIRDLALRRGPSESALSFVVANIGERRLSTLAYADVYGPDGTYLGRFADPVGKRGSYPGCSIKYALALPSALPDSSTVLLFVDNLDQYVWTTQLTVGTRGN